MKYAIVILGGAADEPQPELDGRTPLEAVDAPTLAHLAAVGRLGQVQLIPPDTKPLLPAGPDAALLSLLGYHAAKRYPGHAVLHALGVGLALNDGDYCFELSLLCVIDGVAQPTGALQVPAGEAEAMIRGLLPHLDLPGAVIHPGESHRPGSPAHLLIDPAASAASRGWSEVVTQRPDDITMQPLRKAMPVGGPAGERLQAMIALGAKHLADHELNAARAEMGEPAITHLWPWGQGTLPPGGQPIKPWRERFGLSAVVVSRDPAVRGLARLVGIDAIDLPEPDPDEAGDSNEWRSARDTLLALGRTAAEQLEHYDLIVVHCEAPAHASFEGSPRDKVAAIEQADRLVLKPVLHMLKQTGGRYRLLATPLHTTRLADSRESAGPVPFLVAGEKISSVVSRPMTESAAAEADLQVPFGHEMMEFFLRGGIR